MFVTFHEPSLGSWELPYNIRPERFSRFDVYWIQTDRRTKYIYMNFMKQNPHN